MKQFLTLCLMTLFMALPLTSFRMAESSTERTELPIPKMEASTASTMEFTDVLTVKASYYNAVVSQCDSTPLITASGAFIDTLRATELKWCAISYNLHKRYGGPLEFGDVIEIEGFQGKYKIKGKYVVQDLMNPRWKDKIDILRTVGDNGVTYDSVKIKNKKIKEFKKDLAEQADAKARSLKQQGIHHAIIKALSKVPFIGTKQDVLRPENYVRLQHTILTGSDVSLNTEHLLLQI